MWVTLPGLNERPPHGASGRIFGDQTKTYGGRPAMTYHHLSRSEREVIHSMRRQGYRLRDIGKALGRSESTISRELRRNKGDGPYDPYWANWLAKERRSWSRPKAKRGSVPLMEYVIAALERKWAPAQIAGRLRYVEKPDDPSWWISHTTIYTHIREDHRANGQLFRHLRHGRRKFEKRLAPCAGRGHIPDRVTIDDRPDCVARQERVGDWEADTVWGWQRSGFLVTLVERKTLYLVARIIRDLRADTISQAIIDGLEGIHPALTQTITCDNGSEFTHFRDIERALHCSVYFTHPYSAWERGINENTNGLLRQFIPKKQKITSLTQKKVADYVDQLNNRPRKKLNYRTPNEAFQDAAIALRA